MKFWVGFYTGYIIEYDDLFYSRICNNNTLTQTITFDRSMKLKPGVPKFWLHLSAGVMWSGVGLYLMSLTREWVAPVARIYIMVILLAGILLGVAIYAFGFSKFADKNIRRIESIPSEKPCLFAFQEWTSYPLVVFMISLGIFLRVYSPIPKTWLASMYIGIGFSLFLASTHYYKRIWVNVIGEKFNV